MSTLFQGTKTMTRTTQFLSRMLVVLFTAVMGLNSASAQSADPYKFEKKAYKPDGTPWSGPINVGDTVKYVLSYKPGVTNSGPVTIDDTLSPNQSYVAPTQGPGWTWGASPYATGNHEQYVNPGFGPGTGSVKLTVTGLPKSVAGSGDGTIPIPFSTLDKVFGIDHHSYSANIKCWSLSTLVPCGAVSSGGLQTPMPPQAVIRGDNFYYAARTSTGFAAYGCFNASLNIACSPVVLPEAVSGFSAVAGVVEDNTGRMLLAANNKVFCQNETGGVLSPCAGWPAGGVVTSVLSTPATSFPGGNNANILARNQRVYIHHGSSVVQCLDSATGLQCSGSGWTPSGTVIGSGAAGALIQIATSAIGDGGVCLMKHFAGLLNGCVDTNGVLASSGAIAGGFASGTISAFPIPGTSMVLFPEHGAVNSSPPIKCFDFASGAAVASCVWTQPTTPVNGPTYGFAMDPSKPSSCILALGDTNLLWRFDYKTGEVGCGITTVSTPPIDQLYCNGAPDPTKFQWSSVNVSTPSAAGVLMIKQGGTTATVTLISGTTNYAMPATIAPGYGPLTFSYAPTSGPSSIDLVVGYTSDKNPEICYQAKVSKCGPVFNDAVFKGGLNGAPISVAQKVDLGVAKGPECDPKPPVVTCLSGDAKVTCGEKPGTYVITLATTGAGGVTPTSVSITPTTAGVTIVNPQSSYPVIGGLVKIVVAGANPGDVLTFDMEGTTAGAGSAAGTDLCCNGTIKVTIPKDIKCKQPDISILKTGPKTCVPGQPCTFNITITNNGAPYNGNVLLWDQVSPNAWPVTAITPNVCGTSITTTPFSCVANLNLAANQSMSFAVTMTSSFNGTLTNENCIGVAYAPSWLSPNTSYSKAELKKLFDKYGPLKKQSESCWKVHQQEDKVDLAIKKTGATTPAPGSPFYSFKMDVTNEGAAFTAAAGVLTVTDVVPAGMTFTSVTGTAGWSCAPNTNVPQGTPITCTYAGGALAAGPAAPVGTINISATANGAPPFPPFDNCADVALSPTSGTTDAVAANNKSCVTVTKKDEKSTIKVTKVCEPAKEVIGAINSYVSDCKITVTTTGPQTSLIVVNEALSGGGTVTSASSSTSPAWNCNAANCSINSGLLNQTASTSIIDVKVSFPSKGHVLESQNCAKLSVGQNPVPKPDGESCTKFTVDTVPTSESRLDVKKVVVSNAPMPVDNLLFPVSVNCSEVPAGSLNLSNGPNGALQIGNGQTALAAAGAYNPAATCTIAEGAIPSTNACGFLKPVWTTTYSPSAVVSMSTPNQTVTITNTLECKPIFPPDVDSQLYVKKVVVNNAPNALEPLQFTFSVACLDTNGQTIGAGMQDLSDGQSAAAFGYEPGRTCTLSEGAIPATAACGKLKPVWSTTYAPSQTVNLSPNGETITVTNTLNCEPIADPKLSTFSVSKEASYNGEPILGTPFQMNVTCDDGTAQSLAVLSGQSQTINGLPIGTTCNVVEGKIGTTNLCPKGSVEKWTTTYNPANGSNTTAANSSVAVRVDNLLTCEPIIIDNPLVCDPASATNAGDLCRCRFDNMQQVSKTSCECKDGFRLNPGKGCTPIVVAPKCDPATTVTKGNSCVCEYRNMVQVSKTACACAKGFKFAAGKGCYKPEPVCKQGQRFQPARNRCEPVCAKGFEYSVKRNTCNPARPDCVKGTVYNAKRNRCDKVQPVCRAPFVYNAKINKCVEQVQQCGRGEIKIGGKCRKIPNCPFGQIPIPGTGICVSIGGGGGGGGGPKDDNPKCVPQPGRECL